MERRREIKERKRMINWTYTATNRQHRTVDDIVGENFRWAIKVCAEYGFIHHRKDGYDLYHLGKKIRHGKTVKALKLEAEVISNRKGKCTYVRGPANNAYVYG